MHRLVNCVPAGQFFVTSKKVPEKVHGRAPNIHRPISAHGIPDNSLRRMNEALAMCMVRAFGIRADGINRHEGA